MNPNEEQTRLDAAWMRRAVRQARKGFPMPNPQVGCVLARGDRLIAEGFHAYQGGPHAEAVALDRARGLAQGATAYVTLEPCAHHGRTPPCADALIRAGVSRVVVGVPDPNPAAAGGIARLRAAGITVDVGIERESCEEVNRRWLTAVRRGRPWVTVKAAVTLNGLMAPEDRKQRWITSTAARTAGRRLRAELGAVLVGRGTVEADDPLLTARVRGVVNPPVRVVLDPRRGLTGRERVFGPQAPTWWVTATVAGEWAGVTRDEVDLRELLVGLFTRGLRGVLVEGGPTTVGAFLRSGLVDEVILFIAPQTWASGVPWTGLSQVESGGVMPELGEWRLVRSRVVGEDVMVVLSPALR